jgi:hypothetical protein
VIVVACITFGHTGADVELALGPAVRLAGERSDVRVLTVDDASGAIPALTRPEIGQFVMTARSGFPGVVNHIVAELAPAARRLILVNPDARLDDDAMRRLADGTADVEVPRIVDSQGRLSSVRPVLTPGAQLLALLFGQWTDRRCADSLAGGSGEASFASPPFVASGAVISIDAEILRELPLDPGLFWIEMSDWALRAAGEQLEILGVLVDCTVEHAGASTSTHYPVSVAASQLLSAVTFIRRYGSWWHRVLLPPAVCARVVRIALQHRNVKTARFVAAVACGRRDWRVPR